jgi:hypothetical protein
MFIYPLTPKQLKSPLVTKIMAISKSDIDKRGGKNA